MRKLALSVIMILASVIMAGAQDLRLPTVIGSGMVLQQNEEVNIWGWAKPKSKVQVEAGWLDAPVKVKADADGRWIAKVKTPAGSYDAWTMAVSDGKSEIKLDDILIGEVWLCSGQSNMAWKTKNTLDLKDEMKNAAELGRNVRLYSTGRISAEEPQDDVKDASWERCSSKTVSEFSAVGFGFGLELQAGLDVPVGLIQASYGGTLIEGWVSKNTIENGEKAENFSKAIKIINKRKGEWSEKESHLYNANIHPLLNVRIAGVIWYQGCSNVRVNAMSYRHTLTGLIASWREEFANPEMPFYIAQIAPHVYTDLQGAQLRESQAFVAAHTENCELIVTNDSQEIPGDVHPRLKKNVCHRFAMCALGQHYGKDVGEWRSPAYSKMIVEGSQLRIRFKNLPTTLAVKGDRIIGFQIAQMMEDETLKYYLADARLDASGKCVILSSPYVDTPAGARYCFDESVGNLFSAEGMPVAPFRTDRKNMPMAESARAYIEPASVTPIAFEGEGYQKAVLATGTKLWLGSEMVLFEDSYPKEFEGYEILVSDVVAKGNTSNGGKIIAKEDGRIYFLARADKATRKTWYRGWTMLISSEIAVRRPADKPGDGFKVVEGLFIHYLDVKKGDEIQLHQTDSWSGVIPIAKSIEYSE